MTIMTIEPSLESTFACPVLRTKAGLPKRKLSLEDKLYLLGMGESREATVERLDEFKRLFAFRDSGGIVTKAGQGPR
jgi:hypothetical protein